MFSPDSNWSPLLLAVAIGLAAYLVGSISPAHLVVRRRGQDIRQLGDGNAGAENVARVAGLKAGILVAALDIAKGLLAVLLARALTREDSTPFLLFQPPAGEDSRLSFMLLAGVAAVIGHSWPWYLGGRGGRGAAAGVGVLFGLAPLASLLALLPAFVLLCLTRSSTWGLAAFFIGAVVAATGLGYLVLFGYSWLLASYAVVVPALVGAIHWRSVCRGRPADRESVER